MHPTKKKLKQQMLIPFVDSSRGSKIYHYIHENYLLQNASQSPFGLSAVRFLASLTRTYSVPDVDDELRGAFTLPNFRRPAFTDERANDGRVSGGMNFNATMISPRYDEISSNGSLCKCVK